MEQNVGRDSQSMLILGIYLSNGLKIYISSIHKGVSLKPHLTRKILEIPDLLSTNHSGTPSLSREAWLPFFSKCRTIFINPIVRQFKLSLAEITGCKDLCQKLPQTTKGYCCLMRYTGIHTEKYYLGGHRMSKHKTIELFNEISIISCIRDQTHSCERKLCSHS